MAGRHVDEASEREQRLHFLIILIIMSAERKSTNPFDDEVDEGDV